MDIEVIEGTPIWVPKTVARWSLAELEGDLLHRHLQTLTGTLFDRYSELPLFGLLYAQQAPALDGLPPITDTRVLLTGLVQVDERTKDQLTGFVKALIEPFRLAAVGWVSESWVVSGEGPEVLAELRAWQATHGGSLEGFRLAREAVTMVFDTPQGISMYEAPIERPAEGRPRLGAWVEQKAMAWRGRLMSVFAEGVPAATRA